MKENQKKKNKRKPNRTLVNQPHWIRYVQQPSLRDVTPGCLRIVCLYTSLTSYIQQQNLLGFPWVDGIADYVKVKVKRKESNIYHCK